MALFTWDLALYTVGINQFDEHHMQLVELINNLHDAMMQGKGKDVFTTTLAKLQMYTKFHFSAEEKLMQQKGYIDFENHKKEHEGFILKLSDLEALYNSGSREISIETFRFLKDWLINHIQNSDKKYSTFLK